MKMMRWMLVVVLGLGVSVPAIAMGDTNHAHAAQGDSTKSMKAFTKQQKKNQKKTNKAVRKAQKESKKKAAGQGQAGH